MFNFHWCKTQQTIANIHGMNWTEKLWTTGKYNAIINLRNRSCAVKVPLKMFLPKEREGERERERNVCDFREDEISFCGHGRVFRPFSPFLSAAMHSQWIFCWKLDSTHTHKWSAFARKSLWQEISYEVFVCAKCNSCAQDTSRKWDKEHISMNQTNGNAK